MCVYVQRTPVGEGVRVNKIQVVDNQYNVGHQ